MYQPGSSIPPGFPYDKKIPLNPTQWTLAESGKASLFVVLRISYTDKFGKYCYAVGLSYDIGSFNDFPTSIQIPILIIVEGNPRLRFTKPP